jgi:hypothetical protein
LFLKRKGKNGVLIFITHTFLCHHIHCKPIVQDALCVIRLQRLSRAVSSLMSIETRATQSVAYAPTPEWEVVCGCMEDKVGRSGTWWRLMNPMSHEKIRPIDAGVHQIINKNQNPRWVPNPRWRHLGRAAELIIERNLPIVTPNKR